MSLPTISILSFDRAVAKLGSLDGAKFSHVVSINNPGEGPPKALADHNGSHLILHFHDITSNSVSALRAGFQPPCRQDIERLIDFSKTVDSTSKVLVHCAAGVSRSAAAALILFASKFEPSPATARRVIQATLSVKSSIFPNAQMVKYADEILGYKGSLEDALESAFPSDLIKYIESL